MYDIEIANSQSIVPLDEAFLREVAERTLADEQVAAAEISIAIVDNETIHELNRRYLAHDYETDVLSFLLECVVPEPLAAQRVERRGAGKRIEGEVILSAEMAARRAPEFSWSLQSEVVLYLVHGLLHLVGYDDLTDAERRVMRRRERDVLRFWDLVPGEPSAPAGR